MVYEPVDPKDETIPIHKRVLYGPNQWPPEDALPGFRAALEAYRDACDHLNRTLQTATAEMLGLDRNFFDKYFWAEDGSKLGFASIRILHYTPLSEAAPERIAQLDRAADGDKAPMSLGAHRDATAFFTILINDADGLEVLNHSGEWIQVPPTPGNVIVNIGMPLSFITGGFLLATMHR